MSEIRHMDVAEFRRLGFLQEANRQFFHPHGLALEVRQITGDWSDEDVAGSAWKQARLYDVAEAIRTSGEAPMVHRDGEYELVVDGDALMAQARSVCRALWPQGSMHLSGVWDYRDDPEGIVFGDPDEGDAERAEVVAQERDRHYEARKRLFGGAERTHFPRVAMAEGVDVQPLGWRPEGE